MIITIYIITGFHGPSFWDQDLWKVTHLDHIPFMKSVPNLRLNESFMAFGGVSLSINIIVSYLNVRRSTRAQKKSTLRPLLLLLPFLVPTLIQIAWLSHPQYNHSYIIKSAAFVPFLFAWGLQFAHQVGRMILAHVTSTPFPVWDWIWVWSFLGALDANLPLLGRPPIVQTSSKNTTIFVWVTLAIAFIAYARFVYLVIWDITNYLGIACFTVQKKDKEGKWHSAQPNAKRQ